MPNTIDAEALLGSILDTVPDAIVSITEDGLIAFFSRSAERMFGYGAEEVIGQNVKMLMPAPYRAEHDGYMDHYKTTHEKKIIGIGREVKAQTKNGHVFPIHLSVNEMHVDGRRLFLGIIQDRSRLERAESSTNQLAAILEQSINEIYIADATTYRIVHANQAARENLQYSSTEVEQLHPWDFVDDILKDSIEDLLAPLKNGSSTKLVFETVQVRKDGSTYPVQTQLQLMGSQVPPVYVAVVQDITEQHGLFSDLALRDRAIAEIDTGVLITDATLDDNPIIYANRAMREMTGYDAEELYGRNPRFLQADDRDQSAVDNIRAAIKQAVPVSETLRNYRKDGSRFISEVIISPIRDKTDKVTHFVGVQNDVTARIDMEDRLRQSQKMDAIGQLTGGIAHDFNNLLTIIIGNNELLADRLPKDEFLAALLDDASEAAESAAQLTAQLLSSARQQNLDPKAIELNGLVDSLTDMLSRTLGETISLSTKLAPSLAKPFADPSQVHSALLNLAINARDAMPQGGELTIETSEVFFDAETTDDRVGVEPGRYVRLSVSDTGKGMPPDIRDRVLEPFFTTKERGKGTGLGLSMVHGFAKQSGGHLEIYSEPDIGTTVSLYLPEVDGKGSVTADVVEHVQATQETGETILVVEDDARVRKSTINRLSHLGYKTLQAETGPEALEVLADASNVDLVFTDMVMPGGMTGAELAVKIGRLYPTIKVVIASGYAEQSTVPSDGTPWLRKPYTLKDLSAMLRQSLE